MATKSTRVTLRFKNSFPKSFRNSMTAYKALIKVLAKNPDALDSIFHHGYGNLTNFELLQFSRIEHQEKAHGLFRNVF